MAAKDWECATKGCGHLQYRHATGKGTCLVVKNKTKKHAGDSCPCTKYKPPKGKHWC